MERSADERPCAVPRPPPHLSRRGFNITSFGSQPDMQLMSQSPPGYCHNHRQHQQEYGRRHRRRQSSPRSSRDDNSWREESPRTPPLYSRRESDVNNSPIRLLFPSVASPSAAWSQAAVSEPVTRHPRSSRCRPR